MESLRSMGQYFTMQNCLIFCKTSSVHGPMQPKWAQATLQGWQTALGAVLLLLRTLIQVPEPPVNREKNMPKVLSI